MEQQPTVQELKELQESNLGEARSLQDIVKNEKRDYTTEEWERVQACLKRDEEIAQQIRTAEANFEIENRTKQLKETTRSVGPASYHTQYRKSEHDHKYLGECIRSWILEGENMPNREVERAADNFRIDFTKRAFNLEVNWDIPRPLTRQAIRSADGQSKGEATLGGYTVPTFTEQLVRHIRYYAPLLDYVDLRQVSSGAIDYIPITDTSARRAVLTNEKGTRTKNDIVIDRKQMDFYKYTSRCSDTEEHIEDSSTPMEQLILDVLADDISQQISEVLTLGTGSGQPWGLVASASEGKTSFDKDDWQHYQEIQKSVDPRFWAESNYFGGAAIFNSAATLEDEVRAPLKLFSGGRATVRSMLDYPFVLLPAMAAQGSSGTPKFLLFGTGRVLRVHMVNQVRFFKDEYTEGQDGIVNWSVSARLGSVNVGPSYGLVYAT